MFDCLFQPITINKLIIKNRIIYPALGLCYSQDRTLNERYINFFRERAKGGAGIVTVGPVLFDETGVGVEAPSIADDSAVPVFSRVAEAISNEGAAAWIQLYHAGAYSFSQMMDGRESIAPSSVYSNYSRETPREMSIEDISGIRGKIVRAALRAKEAGFDGIELLGSAGYLISQFLSPLKNYRNDKYGGTPEKRMRFASEIIEDIRTAVGPDYPLTIRMAGNDFVQGSNTDLETPDFARAYEQAGIDGINVTGGWHESKIPQLSAELPSGGFAYLARNIKDAVSVPVAASNRLSDPYAADQVIRDKMADMVSLGRALIADPFWPLKAMSGRENEIRPCISCSQGCTDRLFSGKPVFCLTNARAGFEGSRNISKMDNPARIMVAGAGPAGLEAAIRSAEAGHRVEIYDKNADIGGQLWIAGAPPHKQEMWNLINYYSEMLYKYKIDFFPLTEVDIELIRKKNPDHLFIAQGGEPLIPQIQGVQSSDIVTAWDVLRDDPSLGTDIAIIGGGAVGLETAHFLSVKGTISPETLYFLFKYGAEDVKRLNDLILRGNKKITVFEKMAKAGRDVGKSSRWILMGNLSRHGVEIITSAEVGSVSNGIVRYKKDGSFHEQKFDNIINAAGTVSVCSLEAEARGNGFSCSVIGDSKKTGTIDNAIHDAFLAVSDIRQGQ